MPNFMNLTGQKYGRLTVLDRGPDHVQKSGKKLFGGIVFVIVGIKLSLLLPI